MPPIVGMLFIELITKQSFLTVKTTTMTRTMRSHPKSKGKNEKIRIIKSDDF